MRDAIEQEIATRTVVHQQKVAVLNAAGMHSSSSEAPPRFLAQGDSWFDYPIVGNGPLVGGTMALAIRSVLRMERRSRHDMVHTALIALKNGLQNLANDPVNNFCLIDTLSIVIPQAMWANELHPRPEGFQLIANAFLNGLRNYPSISGPYLIHSTALPATTVVNLSKRAEF